MNNLDKQYQLLLQDILDNGNIKQDRTGTGTISVFGRQIRHKMSEGFPLLTTKNVFFKGIATELIWFLRGDTNIKYLVENGCNIWNGDAYKNYEKSWQETFDKFTPAEIKEKAPKTWQPHKLSKKEFVNMIKVSESFANKWGDLGRIYGSQWRNWGSARVAMEIGNDSIPTKWVNTGGVDQIAELIHNIKTNPDSRRLMVSAWNPGELDRMVLPPCHYGFQIYTRELSPLEIVKQAKDEGIWEDGSGFDGHNEFAKNSEGELFHEYIGRKQAKFKTRGISLKWQQRSVDTFLGLPFNVASYGLLLEILAKECNMVSDELIADLGDTHLYSNHIEQAKEQISREPKQLPSLDIKLHFEGDPSFTPEWWLPSDFEMLEYDPHETIKAPLSN